MAAKQFGLGVLAAVLALTAAGIVPASAEFFGCNDPHTTVTYSSRPLFSPAPRARYSTRYSHEFAAQHSQHATYTSRSSYRRHRYEW